MCAGIIFPLLWAMYADTADYSEYTTGRRSTGLIFSSASFAQKMGWTLGGAVTGWTLAIYGYEANVEQTESAKEGLRMMVSYLPAIGALLSGVFIYFYSLTDQTVEEINIKLRQGIHLTPVTEKTSGTSNTGQAISGGDHDSVLGTQ